ncbi:hypothetical protein CAY53_05870 [Desulfobulbus oralis]|uniref:Uncharacterized protein n=1 Tax=Desulfobulbus oralis TaxID=1986146 RepID=A0A2L1GN75_9BACT|nr:hypothetical protein CAY53_05870 [Desulfobulbus oralis]
MPSKGKGTLFRTFSGSLRQPLAGFSGNCQSGSNGVIWRSKKQESLNPGDVYGRAASRQGSSNAGRTCKKAA